MPFVDLPFKHDVFISYSHGSDDDGAPTEIKNWSLAFANELEAQLRAPRRYRSATMFVDSHPERRGQRLKGAESLSAQLEKEAGASALLLVVMSPDYQASKWCGKEREWWWDHQSAVDVSPEGRVVLVNAWPLEEEWQTGSWPRELCDRKGEPLMGHKFHSDGDEPRPLGWTQWSAGFDSAVKTAVLKVAGEVFVQLTQTQEILARRAAARDDAQRLANPAGQTIYLHARADRQSEWERVVEALQAAGYAVLPGEPEAIVSDPKQQAVIREQRVKTLADCDALLLLGSQSGRDIDDDLIVVGKHDRNSARTRSGRWLPCALLDIAGAAVATPMRCNNARILQVDWLDGSLGGGPDATASLVRKWLVEKAAICARP